MQVVFLKNVKGSALMGDSKKVSDGYGKYLITNNIAKKASKSSLSETATLRKKSETERSNKEAWAQNIISKSADLVITVKADANSEGHLYGSVDAKAISEQAVKEGLDIKVEDIVLPHGLKEVGEHQVELDLTPEYKTMIKVIIEPK